MLEVEPMVDSTPLLGDAEALRRRAEEDGLLFFKGLLDRETVLGLRRLMIDVLARRGLVDPGGGPCRERVIHEAVDAQPKAEVIEQCMTVSLYNELQALEAFHALPHSPPLLELFATLFGERPLPHPRNIARVIMPGERFFPTPPHQDHPLIQGALEVWTSWIPLGDVPLALGPLALMPGSHKAGVLDTYVVPGAGGTGAKISHLPPRWVSADFEAGDIVTFSSLTVHRALPQQDRDIVRLSLDCRYQPASKPIQALSLQPHIASYATFDPSKGPAPRWADIYAGWQSEALKYYWRDYDLTIAPFDAGAIAFMQNAPIEHRAAIKARAEDMAGL